MMLLMTSAKYKTFAALCLEYEILLLSKENISVVTTDTLTASHQDRK